MKALIVNDDGIDSPGLAALARVAVAAGLDVQVAAPHIERSGASAALSALEDDGKLKVSRRSMPELPDVDVLAVHASPALITFVASYGAFGDTPDLVLSGINLGPNTGRAILHSGTVGAALTAAAHGARAVALSLNASDPSSWETAEYIAERAVRWSMEHGEPGEVLNVNIPDVPVEELHGLREAQLAEFGAVQAEISDSDEDYDDQYDDDDTRTVTMSFKAIDIHGPDDTDAVLLSRGWATATVLQMPFEMAGSDLGDLGFSRDGVSPS
ncbi:MULTISPECIES: 5'/3'-nucleotidase SurE [unclassified Rhodococcus (in: high G+C Gram-positive bacteria)]|uniref:5'/3'-nucleotidase SurE n=1 Tax=unclassified Rhodococcus (in: high G+C Gram-positive bacteria) TaxID=192944 RepID=UPI00146C03DD|nr:MULTISPECIES: 5'/3'-nucleotidase SurE [unclassified Rhodococcus (in: high G+C Gram-positive bacteria)]NMD94083.1 5'/3'-nucleotidase SurE [Rhodococcus sp. BL-253-APC-6A1W]NME77671.1 5'/3'-nucleotidase SurE [Rhodococcus sp. 105337]